MLRTTLLRLATAAAVAAAVLPAPARAAGCTATWRKGGWTSVTAPTFPAPVYPGQSSQGWPRYPLVAAGATPAEAFVTDGYTVLRTVDGGCTWSTAYRLGSDTAAGGDPGGAAGTATGLIGEIVAAPPAGARTLSAATSVYLLVYPITGIAYSFARTPLVVVASHDDGAHWVAAAVTAFCGSSVAESILYAGGMAAAGARGVSIRTDQPRLDGTRDAHAVISTDGGTTWRCAAPNTAATQREAFDPADPRIVWSAGCSGLNRSTDAGAQWTALRRLWEGATDYSCSNVDALDVRHVGAGPARLTLLMRTIEQGRTWFSYRVFVSADGGTSWQGLGVVAHDPGEIAYGAVAGDDGGPAVLVGIGAISPSSPTGYSVRRWSARRRGWVDVSSLVARMPSCTSPAVTGLAAVQPGDATHASVLLRADIHNGQGGCPAVLVRYALH